MTSTTRPRPVLQRLRIELASRDLVFVATLIVGVAVVQAIGDIGGPTTGFVGVMGSSLEILVALWPIVGALPAALIAARDEESGVREALAANGRPVEAMRDAGLLAGMGLSLALIVSFTASTGLVGLTGGAEIDSFSVGVFLRYATALVVTTPVLAAFGMAVGRLTRSRAGAVGVLAGAALLAEVIATLATVIPVARWLHLGTPVGLLDLLANGLGAENLPRHVSPYPVVAWMAVLMAGSLGLVRWADRRPAPRRRRPRSMPTPARWAAVAGGAVAFGFVGPTVAVDALPWQYSPTWVLDQASKNTPDLTVAEFLDHAVDGRIDEADALTIEHDAGRTLGPLGEVLASLRNAKVDILRQADVAGTVSVSWPDARGAIHEVRACTVRTTTGWRVAHFTSRPQCGMT